MKKSFEGKVVLITGSSSGLGEALSYRFAQEGASVILLARRFELIFQTAEKLTRDFNKCIAISCDVTKDDDLENAVKEGLKHFGKIDIVVANAGFGVPGDFENLKLEDYGKQFEVNVFGVLRTIYATLPELKKSKGGLCIIGSVNGAVPFFTGTSAYIMSKFAVRGLISPLSLELSRHEISVTHIMPGFIDTEFDSKYSEEKKEKYNWLKINAEKAATVVIQSIKNKEREVIIGVHGKIAVYLERYAPFLLRGLTKIIKK